MLINAKGITLDREVVLNDDEQTPISLVGKKMLPILLTDDAVAMPESLDIINYLDNLDSPILGEYAVDEFVSDWFGRAKPALRCLIYPRMVMHPFAEFKTRTARDYFMHKKTASTGSFPELIKSTDQYLQTLGPLLDELSAYLSARDSDSAITWDDLYLFPWVYLLGLVDGLVWPEACQEYLHERQALCHLPSLAK